MLTCNGPKVIEFNVRFGDPEAQVVLPLIDGELAPVLVAAARRCAAGSRDCAQPGEVRRGRPRVPRVSRSRAEPGVVIRGLEQAAALENVVVFHAGTAHDADGSIVTAGGRVLTVVGSGATYDAAIARAYAGVRAIDFDGMQYRSDIGQKALADSKPSRSSWQCWQCWQSWH